MPAKIDINTEFLLQNKSSVKKRGNSFSEAKIYKYRVFHIVLYLHNLKNIISNKRLKGRIELNGTLEM